MHINTHLIDEKSLEELRVFIKELDLSSDFKSKK